MVKFLCCKKIIKLLCSICVRNGKNNYKVCMSLIPFECDQDEYIFMDHHMDHTK